MGRTSDVTALGSMNTSTLAAIVAATFAAGCSVFGGGPGYDAGTPASAPAEREEEAASETESSSEPEVAAALPDLFEERMLAGDYEGMLAIYAADSTLHSNEEATFGAALAAARAGHPAHDPGRAADLFSRLLDDHPFTSRRFEVEVYLDLLARERDLRAAVRRLDRELQQLKAIDLGQVPAEEP
jgi:hypothetical protein